MNYLVFNYLTKSRDTCYPRLHVPSHGIRCLYSLVGRFKLLGVSVHLRLPKKTGRKTEMGPNAR